MKLSHFLINVDGLSNVISKEARKLPYGLTVQGGHCKSKTALRYGVSLFNDSNVSRKPGAASFSQPRSRTKPGLV